MMSELEIQAQLYFFLGRLDMAELLLEYTKDVDHVVLLLLIARSVRIQISFVGRLWQHTIAASCGKLP